MTTDTRPAPPRWSTVLLFGAFLGLLLLALGLWVTEAEGQAKQAGVGLPGLPRADFSFSWCEQKRPCIATDISGKCTSFRSATCTDKAPPTFDCRLCPSNGWLGYYAEFFPRTEAMLRGCWEQNLWGTRQTHSGVYTMPEFGWAEVSTPRAHEWYRRCWYEGGTVEGGTAVSPIPINAENLRFNLDRIDCIKALGAWPAAGATGSYLGFDPNHPADICANRFPPPGARPLWPVWVRNDLPADHPVNAGTPPPPVPVPPPPPLPPPPPPEPPPPSTPSCGPKRLANCQAGDFRFAICAGCDCPAELVDAGLPLQSQPGRFCTPVEPPPPVQTCTKYAGTLYIPSELSTGRLTLELVPQGEGPCP